MLKDGVDAKAFINNKSLRNKDGVLVDLKNNVTHTYTGVFSGFSAALDDEQLRSLESMPEVCFI